MGRFEFEYQAILRDAEGLRETAAELDRISAEAEELLAEMSAVWIGENAENCRRKGEVQREQTGRSAAAIRSLAEQTTALAEELRRIEEMNMLIAGTSL